MVDNASRDETAGLIGQRFPEVSLLQCDTNLGFCRANNLGIARTRSPFVLVLNPDTRLTPRFLEELLPAFDDPLVGLAAGKLLRFDEKTIDSAGQTLGRSRQPLDRGYGQPDSGQFDRDEEVFSVCGAAALYRRTMLESIADGDGQFFDESFFAFYEDLDLAWRARKLGWKAAYRYRAVAYHARGGSAGAEGVRARWRALLTRSPDIRYHIVKNRYLTILRNDTAAAYLKDQPFILGRDAATIALLLMFSPSVLARLWRARPLFRAALERREQDAVRPRFSTANSKHYDGPR